MFRRANPLNLSTMCVRKLLFSSFLLCQQLWIDNFPLKLGHWVKATEIITIIAIITFNLITFLWYYSYFSLELFHLFYVNLNNLRVEFLHLLLNLLKYSIFQLIYNKTLTLIYLKWKQTQLVFAIKTLIKVVIV